jgi:hypothetical protein
MSSSRSSKFAGFLLPAGFPGDAALVEGLAHEQHHVQGSVPPPPRVRLAPIRSPRISVV